MARRFFLCLCLCLLLTASALAEEVVLYVSGEAITQADLDDRIQNSEILNRQTSESLTEEEIAARTERAYREALLSLISERALLQEAERRGYTRENEEVRAAADTKYEAMIASVERYVLASYPTLSGEELAAQVDSLLDATGADREKYRQIAVRSAQLALLDAALACELPQPGAQDIAARYEQLYDEQTARFADENAFEAAMLQGEIVVHRPVTLKLIHKAEFPFEEGAYALIVQTEAINADMAKDMRADQLAKCRAAAEAAREAVMGGDMSFAELLESLKAGSSGTVNYFHESSTRFPEAYHSRAAAFTQPGEVSTAYAMHNGYALLCYAGDLPACDRVPLEEVEEAIAAQLREERQSEKLTRLRTEIVVAADITYPEGSDK